MARHHCRAHLPLTSPGRQTEYLYSYVDFNWPVLVQIPYKVARETDVLSLQFTVTIYNLKFYNSN